jgi:hypothetical protein
LVTNTTNDTFTLVTKPGDGLRYMVLEPQEMEHVPFSEPRHLRAVQQGAPGHRADRPRLSDAALYLR